jgi:hypothetical protein
MAQIKTTWLYWRIADTQGCSARLTKLRPLLHWRFTIFDYGLLPLGEGRFV